MTAAARPLVTAGMVLGIGLGGFVDGIVLHQLQQLHDMLSGWMPKATIANVEVNMFWAGLFHAGTCSRDGGRARTDRPARHRARHPTGFAAAEIALGAAWAVTLGAR